MKHEVSFLIEPLLSQFFLIDAICKGFLEDSRRAEIFEELAGVFCVPIDDEVSVYYTESDSALYKSITDYAAYERLCRTIEFAQRSGQDVGLTSVDRVILAKKRESMQIKSEIFKQSKNLTSDLIVETLVGSAQNGNVDAMVTLAYMEYHGICMSKDEQGAIRRFRLCAKWNNLFGNLMGIAYDKERESDYYDTLYTVLRTSNRREVFGYLCAYRGYSAACTKKNVAKIIEDAFGLGIVQKNTYDRIFAKVAFSELLCDEDKEKLLLNRKKDAIASLSEIPFDASRDTAFAFDADEAKKLPLERTEETEKLLCSLSPALSGHGELYRVLLVASDDDYVSEMYVDALKRGFDGRNRVIEVDAGMLSLRDFACAKENFVLRGLSETKQTHTVFLVKHADELGEQETEELVKLLDYDYRRRFKLCEPTVSLDLSDVLIVLFASAQNESVRRLSEECEVVCTARISESEKCAVIDTMFRSRSAQYGIDRVTLEEEGRAFLAPFGTGQISRIIDGALKKAAYDRESVVTVASLKTVTTQQSLAGRKREFGYTGGAFHEEY